MSDPLCVVSYIPTSGCHGFLKRWREELETETAHHRERLEQADRDKTDSMLALRKKMEALGLSKTNEIAQLQEIHRHYTDN